MVVFYFLSPIPSLLARRHSDDSASNPCRELAYFLTTGVKAYMYIFILITALHATYLVALLLTIVTMTKDNSPQL